MFKEAKRAKKKPKESRLCLGLEMMSSKVDSMVTYTSIGMIPCTKERILAVVTNGKKICK